MEEYRVYYISNDLQTKFYSVSGPKEAIKLINEMAKRDLKRRKVTWNLFGLEERDPASGEWSEWYNENGDAITELLET